MAGITVKERTEAELVACKVDLLAVLQKHNVTLTADGYTLPTWVELHKDGNFIKWELDDEC